MAPRKVVTVIFTPIEPVKCPDCMLGTIFQTAGRVSLVTVPVKQTEAELKHGGSFSA